MKNRKFKAIVFAGIIALGIIQISCIDPVHNLGSFISLNKTSYEMAVYSAYNSDLVGGALATLNNEIFKDKGGQLDLDTIVFIIGTDIILTGNPDRTHELVGAFDTITYINPSHLSDLEFEKVKDRSFFNIDNWLPEGKNYVYSVYDSDFN